MNRILALLALSGSLWAADPPEAAIENGALRARVYLPDVKNGFYRGTRFDWSGVLYSLVYQGHNFYGPWFQERDASVHDFVYRGDRIVAGPCSAVTGPVDEFRPLGWEDAQPGGTFVKIGVGALRKPANGRYDNYHVYEIADPGRWSVRTSAHAIEFVQTLEDAGSGYAYVYEKVVNLGPPGEPQMRIGHRLKNTGRRAIRTSVYNHNFLVLDGRAPGPGFSITVPFQIRTSWPVDSPLAAVRGKQIAYLKTLADRDVVAMPIEGFGAGAADHEFRIEDTRSHAGMRVECDRPLERESLWSIRSVVAVEPFVSIEVAPGQEFAWTSTYTYFAR